MPRDQSIPSRDDTEANMNDLIERLRQDAEMLKDGHQENLTELWHSDVVKDAAKDLIEAADEINRLRALLHHSTERR